MGTEGTNKEKNIRISPKHRTTSNFISDDKLIDDTGWGSKLSPKTDGSIRIYMENINNITSDHDNHFKLDNAKRWLIKNEIDIACWLEVGVPWHKRKRKNRLPELMKDNAWSTQRTVSANNKHECTGKRQFGGTAIMTFDYITRRYQLQDTTPLALDDGRG